MTCLWWGNKSGWEVVGKTELHAIIPLYAATDAKIKKKLRQFFAKTAEGQFKLTTETTLADESGSASSAACDVVAARRATTCT
jgi:hypothetical protein